METTTINYPDIMSRKQAAQFLGVCVTTLDRLDIPRARVRDRVLYSREVLKQWIVDQSKGGKRGKK